MEITLFNQLGEPEAYIDRTKENTIFLWNGKPVAYILEDAVYSWEGEHIGWFEDDVFYDIDGFKIGSTKWSCPTVTGFEPVKESKLLISQKRAPIEKIERKRFVNAYRSNAMSKYLDC